MQEELILAPAKGRQVRHPDGKMLAAEGETVLVDSYWYRRINDGDVVTIDAEPETKKGK